MRVISNISKCASRGCNNTPVIIRCLGFTAHLEYDGHCEYHQYMALLVDHRDYLLTPEQAQLEIIKHKL